MERKEQFRRRVLGQFTSSQLIDQTAQLEVFLSRQIEPVKPGETIGEVIERIEPDAKKRLRMKMALAVIIALKDESLSLKDIKSVIVWSSPIDGDYQLEFKSYENLRFKRSNAL